VTKRNGGKLLTDQMDFQDPQPSLMADGKAEN